MTVEELMAAVGVLLEMRSPEVMSAGEVTTALQAAGMDVKRPAVKRACEAALVAGIVFGEYKQFERNGGTRPGTAYGRHPARDSAKATVVDDPDQTELGFALADERGQ